MCFRLSIDFDYYLQLYISFSRSVDINASKGFVALWVHFFVVIDGFHQNGYRWKGVFFASTKLKHV